MNNSKTYICFTLYIHIGERVVLFEGFLLELPGEVQEFLVYKYSPPAPINMICNVLKGVFGEKICFIINALSEIRIGFYCSLPNFNGK